MSSDIPHYGSNKIKARMARRVIAQQVRSLIKTTAGAGGLCECDIDLIKRLAQHLGNRPASCTVSRYEARLIDQFRQLSEPQQEGIIKLMKAFAPAGSAQTNPSKGDA